jgi:hypothetical protein
MYLDSQSCTQLNHCIVIVFRLRLNLYRDAAPVPFANFLCRDYLQAVYQACTAITPAPNKNCAMPTFAQPPHSSSWQRKASAGKDGKEYAVPSLSGQLNYVF